jgi:hypothetical protein
VLSQVSRPVSEVRRAGRTTLSRTAKACGPGTRCWCQAFAEDASGRPDIDASPISARRRRQEGIRLRGERAISRQPTAQGRPGCSGFACGFPPVHCLRNVQHRGHGCRPAPGLPCALVRRERTKEMSKTRAKCVARTRRRVILMTGIIARSVSFEAIRSVSTYTFRIAPRNLSSGGVLAWTRWLAMPLLRSHSKIVRPAETHPPPLHDRLARAAPRTDRLLPVRTASCPAKLPAIGRAAEPRAGNRGQI